MPFSHDEDQKLLEIIHNSIKSKAKIFNGLNEEKLINWKNVSKEMGNRSVRQCKERYLHYLSPYINKKEWTNEEDALLISSVTQHGKKWKVFEDLFKNRTEIDIRNRYHVIERRISKVIRSNLSQNDINVDNSASAILNVKEIYFDVFKPQNRFHNNKAKVIQSNLNDIKNSDNDISLVNNGIDDGSVIDNNDNGPNSNTEKIEDVFSKMSDISIDECKAINSKKRLLLFFNGCVYDNYYVNDSTFS